MITFVEVNANDVYHWRTMALAWLEMVTGIREQKDDFKHSVVFQKSAQRNEARKLQKFMFRN